MLKRKSDKNDYSKLLEGTISRKRKKINRDLSNNKKIVDYFQSTKKKIIDINKPCENEIIIKSEDLPTKQSSQLDCSNFKRVPFLDFKNIVFPMIIETYYFKLKDLPIFTILSIDKELNEYESLNLVKDGVIGYLINYYRYLNKELSQKIYNLLKFPIEIFATTSSMQKIYLVLHFHREKYKENSIESVEFDLHDIFYRFKNSFEIPSQLVKLLVEMEYLSFTKRIDSIKIPNELIQILTREENKKDNFSINSSFFYTQKSEYENYCYLSQLENTNLEKSVIIEKSIDDDQEEEEVEMTEKELFLIEQFDLIVYNVLNKNRFLFKEDELTKLKIYIGLEPSSKLTLINFYLRVKFWMPCKSNHAHNLNSKGLIHDFNILFEGDENVKDFNYLFTFLFNLTNDNLKLFKKYLKQIIKNKVSNLKDSDNYKEIITSILVNNPFYQMFIEDKTFRYLCDECSLIITKANLSSEKIHNYKISRQNPITRIKYISKFLKATHMRKLKINFSNKKLLICLELITDINKYLNDPKTSSFEKFFSHSNNRVLKIKKIFRDHYSDFFSLDKCFEQAFDIASKIFFFFSGEFKTVTCLTKEYLGFAIFEKYDNFLTSQLSNQENSFLLPIFKDFNSFRTYYSLYQLKHSLIINLNGSNSLLEVLLVNYELFKVLVDRLVKLSILKELKIFHYLAGINFKEIVIEDQYEELIDLMYMLLIETQGFIGDVKEGFLIKFTESFIAVEILTIFAQIADKLEKFKLAILLYLILLSTGMNYSKRGFYWYRLILLYKNRSKSFPCKNYKEIIKIAEKDQFIKAEYLFKIRKHCQKENKSNTIFNQISSTFFSEFFKEITIKVPSTNKGRICYFNLKTKDYSSVEKSALAFYQLKRNFDGVHAENQALPALYNALFWDIIYYDKVKYVFQSPYQTFPLDLFSIDFYENRKKLIHERIEEINNYTDNQITNDIKSIFTRKKNVKTVFIRWDSKFVSQTVLICLACSIKRRVLTGIFLEFTRNLKFCLNGMPDLFLWKKNSHGYESLIVEVKSANDRLSDKQKYWINLLTSLNQNVELLHIEKEN